MIREYKTIEEISGPLMVVKNVQNVTYDELAEVELTDGSLLDNYGQLESLQHKVTADLKTVLGIQAKVTLCEPKSIERFQGKAKRIVDLRNEK